MTIADVFETSKHRENIAHFNAIVRLASVDGEINAQELPILRKFAAKLDISDEEYKSILKRPNQYPLVPINSSEERLKNIYDLFKIIYADNMIDTREKKLIIKYAIGLGVPIKRAHDIIEKSIHIFEGRIAFEEYMYLLK